MFGRMSIPLVRRIYPSLIANKIMSVQPLTGPTSLIYYLNFRHSSNLATPAHFYRKAQASLPRLNEDFSEIMRSATRLYVRDQLDSFVDRDKFD